MGVGEMSTQQKTMHIIGLMDDWSIWGRGDDGDDIVVKIGGVGAVVLQSPGYLYAEKWMFLAWRALNWAAGNQMFLDYFREDGFMEDIEDYGSLPPAKAQAAWLDKILELAVEADML